MKILTLETTCDETAAAVVTGGLGVLGAVVASQDDLHRRFGGVVPEIASRAHVERILPVIDEALRAGRVDGSWTPWPWPTRPAWPARCWWGWSPRRRCARPSTCRWSPSTTSRRTSTPAGWPAGRGVFPCVGLIISGGHTSLYRCRARWTSSSSGNDRRRRGGGFDKVAAMLGLPYPGGPSISGRRQRATRAYAFPRPSSRTTERLDFSFSGLKTAVRYAIAGPGKARLPLHRPRRRSGRRPGRQFPGGGRRFWWTKPCGPGRTRAARFSASAAASPPTSACAAAGRKGRAGEAEPPVAPLQLCTDNAVMGAIAVERWKAGLIESLDLDVVPGVLRRGRQRKLPRGEG